MADIDWFVGEFKVQFYCSEWGYIYRIFGTENHNIFDKILSSGNHGKNSQDIDALHRPHGFSILSDKECPNHKTTGKLNHKPTGKTFQQSKRCPNRRKLPQIQPKLPSKKSSSPCY